MNENLKTEQPKTKRAPQPIKNMFSGVAHRYDLANRVLSLGRDIFWRKALARRIKTLNEGHGHLLDLAAGTGDQIVAAKQLWPNLKVTGVDLSAPMLELAQPKFERLAPPPPVMMVGDALSLPFEKNSFESVSISFGLRNIPPRSSLYQEVLRVLKPGGRFLVLEMFHDSGGFISPLVRFYLEKVVPILGGKLLSQEYDAYRYLAGSILAFPQPDMILGEMEQAGFEECQYRTYTFGAVMLVWGEKPQELPVGEGGKDFKEAGDFGK